MVSPIFASRESTTLSSTCPQNGHFMRETVVSCQCPTVSGQLSFVLCPSSFALCPLPLFSVPCAATVTSNYRQRTTDDGPRTRDSVTPSPASPPAPLRRWPPAS